MKIIVGHGSAKRVFERPSDVFRAHEPGETASILRRADRAVDAGAYVAGFFTYEAGLAFVPKQRPPLGDAMPCAQIGVYDAPPSFDPSARPRDGGAEEIAPIVIGPLVPQISKSRYAANVAAVLERITRGDVYQVNLAAPFTFSFAGDPLALFETLTRAGAYEHCAFVDCGDYAVVSCSPELFVRFDGDRLTARPMKGTAPSDDATALATQKNRAEHVMIVDLLRNDLHRIAQDVEVTAFGEVERYPSFATMTSTIVAHRARRFTLAETFAAMFPCGSITGAPKVTAMHAIAELEGVRGAFCGSIGYCAPDGTGTWNVAIRTATIERATQRGTVHVGGGVVADSTARDEWAEILVKRRFIDRVAPPFALLETMRREPDGTYPRLDAHLARIARAADDLHFAFDEVDARRRLAALGQAERAALVRLELDVRGTMKIDTRELDEVVDVTLVWSDACLDEREPLQRYKTTWRPHYAAAGGEAAVRGAFDALLCNRSGAVADGSRVNVFVERAGEPMLLTPPVADGALPGILRADLIASGRAREARLTRADVANARALFAGNGARGLLRATLVREANGYDAAIDDENSGARRNGIAIG